MDHYTGSNDPVKELRWSKCVILTLSDHETTSVFLMSNHLLPFC